MSSYSLFKYREQGRRPWRTGELAKVEVEGKRERTHTHTHTAHGEGRGTLPLGVHARGSAMMGHVMGSGSRGGLSMHVSWHVSSMSLDAFMNIPVSGL